MGYAPPVDRAHLQWLMEQVEARCKNPGPANIYRVKGGRDLELCIAVSDVDRPAITPEFLAEMTAAMKERTGIFQPVIYLDGQDEPEDPDPYY